MDFQRDQQNSTSAPQQEPLNSARSSQTAEQTVSIPHAGNTEAAFGDSLSEKRAEPNAQQSAPQPNVGPPPDGGSMAWLQVVGAWCAILNSWGYVNAWAIFQDYYESSLLSDVSASTISWIGALQGFFILAFTLVGGRLIDQGYMRQLLVLGTFLTSFGAMMASLSTKWYQVFLAQGVCLGLGSSCAFICAVTTVAQYFSTKRATALGLATTGSSVGGILYPAMAHKLIDTAGYPWAMRAIGFVMLATLLITCLIMRARIPPRVKGPLIDWHSFKELNFIMTALGSLCGGAGIFVYIFYIDAYATSTGNVKWAPYMIVFLNCGAVPGRILPNLLADKIGPYNVFVPCVLLCGVLTFVWIKVTSVAGQIVFAVIYGFISGTYVSLIPSVWTSLTLQLNKIGARNGLGFALTSFCFLICGPATGTLIANDSGRYLHAQIFGGVMCFASVGFLGIVRWRRMPRFLGKV